MRSMKGKFIVSALLLAAALSCDAVSLATSSHAPVKVWTNASGRVVHDFGKDAFGWLELKSTGTHVGGELEISLGEKLKDDGVDMKPGGTIRAAKCKAKASDLFARVPLKADARNTGSHAVKLPYEIGVVMPFRYVETPPGAEARQIAVHVPMDMSASSFKCSCDKMNEVYDFCKYTVFATSFAGVYVDGDRERIPYEADAYINMLGEQAIWPNGDMARATILHLLDNPTWPTEWQLHMPMMARDYWMATGDVETMRANYSRLVKLLLRDRARSKDGLLSTTWKSESLVRDIVDWPPHERDGFVFREVNAVVNAFHIRALRDMSEIAAAIGAEDDAKLFAGEAKSKAASFQSVFVDTSTGIVRDGEGTDHSSIHANAIALAFGLVPEGLCGRTMEHVRSRGMACSTYFAQYLLEACFAEGAGEYALSLMTAQNGRSWLGMMKEGSTMCMEAWNIKAKPNQDWNHAWSSAPLNMATRFILGVRPLEPGAAKVLVAPNLCGMDFAEGIVPTVRGPVIVKAEGRVLLVEAPVPVRVVWCGKTHELVAGHHVLH